MKKNVLDAEIRKRMEEHVYAMRPALDELSVMVQKAEQDGFWVGLTITSTDGQTRAQVEISPRIEQVTLKG